MPREFSLRYKIYIVWSALDEYCRKICVERDDDLHGIGEDYLGMLFDWRDELVNKMKSGRRRLTRDACCKILGISENATKTEIKKAYRCLASKYHPDKHDGQMWAEEMFKEISEAYRMLIS